MYHITRQTVRHSKDVTPTSAPWATVNCSHEELVTKVMPRLKKLAAAENLTFRFTGSDTRIRYVIREPNSISLDIAIKRIESYTLASVSLHNDTINHHNAFTRRNNKKLYKPIDDGVKPIVKIQDYVGCILPRVLPAGTALNGYIITEGDDIQ